jgi:hypothetical protein
MHSMRSRSSANPRTGDPLRALRAARSTLHPKQATKAEIIRLQCDGSNRAMNTSDKEAPQLTGPRKDAKRELRRSGLEESTTKGENERECH